MTLLDELRPLLRERSRQAAFAALGLSALMVAAGAWRLAVVRREGVELQAKIAGRMGRLADDRRTTTQAPAKTLNALDRSHAVSQLRSALSQAMAKRDCKVTDFTASTDEAPYITVYALDSKDPGWMQVPVRATVQGRSTAVAEAIAGLRTLDVPFEIDGMEVARRSTDNAGMTTVAAQIGLRVLFYKGEG